MSFDLEQVDKIARTPAAAGAAGAVAAVVLRVVPGDTWRGRLAGLTAGFFCAYYLGPVAAAYFHVEGTRVEHGLAFAIGLFGVSLVSAGSQLIKDLKLAELVSAWFGRARG